MLTASASSTFVDPLATLISSGGGAIGAAVGAFSLLAIVTSCLGTALGLSSPLPLPLPLEEEKGGARRENKWGKPPRQLRLRQQHKQQQN